MALLGFTERETWHKTIYQLNTLLLVHMEFSPWRQLAAPKRADGDELDALL